MSKPIVLAINPKTGDVFRIVSAPEAKEALAAGTRLIAVNV